MLIRHTGEDGVLWVADSIISNVDFEFLSKQMKRKIKSVKAYTVSYDEDARFPDKNFLDVIDKELGNGSYDTLVIGGGSVDISNLDTSTEPEKNLPDLREKVIASAHKLFCTAETVLSNFPAIRKIVIMKRTPRYDSCNNDPLGLKPQLSSLADSVTFGVWCDSKFKKKIIIGGQDIPSGDNEHNDVFGNPGEKSYDGLHMRGPAGRSFLTRSIQKVLMKAQLIEKNNDLYVHEGWMHSRVTMPNTNRDQRAYSTMHQETVPKGRKPPSGYNAMDMMMKRIRTISTATQKNRQSENDEVFHKVDGRNQKTRHSVIKTVPKEDLNLQQYYNVPVHNPFTDLLN